MTVAQLQKILQHYPQDTEVLLRYLVPTKIHEHRDQQGRLHRTKWEWHHAWEELPIVDLIHGPEEHTLHLSTKKSTYQIPG